MSMNLYFEVRVGTSDKTELIDFPFQTPTDLTYAVLRAESVDEQIRLVSEYLSSRTDSGYAEEVISEIKEKLNTDGYSLTYM